MRAVLVFSLVALLSSAALAQSPPAASAATAAPSAPSAAAPAASAAARRSGGDITRDQYIEHAKQLAERRFDRMDTDHDGILTAEERRAWREGHSRRHAAAPEPAAAPAPK